MAHSNQPTSLRELAFVDLEREISVTRRVLERLPEDRFDWKPHEKSMSLGRLAMHVATLLQWFLDTIEKDEFDLASPIDIPQEPKNRTDLLETFEKNARAVAIAMERIDDESLTRHWTLRQAEKVLLREPRIRILRTWCLNHLIHHRAQLCVYLRLMNVAVPAIYFNSADEPEWVFT